MSEFRGLPRPAPPAARVVRFDSEALYQALDKRRRELGITRRELLRRTGDHSPSTMQRLGAGRTVSADALVRLLYWLGETDLKPYMTDVESEPAHLDRPGGEAGVVG